ncbi:MAG: hypothetical protein AAFV07_20270 [Bacteroidota bacterium]
MFTYLIVLLLVAGGFYFAYWAIQKVLKDDKGRNRQGRRATSRRR